MNIKIRLSLQFTLIVTAILLFFSLLVYYFFYTSQVAKFRRNLYDNAKNRATLLINVAEVDSFLIQKIQQSTISWEEEELAVTDSSYNLVYGNNIKFLADIEVLKNAAHGLVNFFSLGNKDGVCYRHDYGNKSYFVYALALDKTRVENISDLRKVLFWSIMSSILLSVLLSYIFAKRAIKPISKIIKSVKEINSLKLNSRLDEGGRKDEIAELATTFNDMLSDLEIAFRNQEDFVSNASHELRTPLTVMIGETDYILSHERTREEYAKHISELDADLKKLNSLLNNLLELAQINSNKPLIFSNVRIDEIVFTSIFQVKAKYPGRKIIPRITYPDHGNDLLINGNEGLLVIAFNNLLDNACKFSTEDVIIEFTITDPEIYIAITDSGIGIPEDELNRIGKPFRRGANVKFIGGFGIGLSLVSRILELHQTNMDIRSDVNSGTIVSIRFSRTSSTQA
jgi:signal transduction histidine kinase